MATVDTNQSGSKLTMERLQSEAIAFARSNGRTETGALYREGTRKGTTPEQAIAASLEANPEVYAAYRAKHNAGALIAQLQAAGAKIQFE